MTQQDPTRTEMRTATIVGGGLAGLAAAVRLSERGVKVTVVETRKRLGGRATSFTDPATGDTLDNCQHVLMGCCTNLIDLYERLGVVDRIEWHSTLHFADPSGRVDSVRADDLPAPFHLTRATLGMKTLSWADKLAVARGMLAILQLGNHGRRATSELTFADWLAEYDQPATAVERFWAPVAISACNELPERLAAAHAIQVFQEGFLAHEEGYRVGIAGVPLVELYQPAAEAVAGAGGAIRTGVSAERFDFDGRRVVGLRLSGGETLRSDIYLSAVPFDRLAKLASDLMVASDERLQHLGELEVSPIIGIHLFFQRDDGQAVTDLPHVALIESPLHWVFNKGQVPAGHGAAGAQHLHVVISAAYEWVERPADQIISMAVAEIRRHLPGAEGARLVHVRVVKEKRATFAATPEAERIRPRAAGAIRNFFLAGDWTATGWPATMEGAVRSGYNAADAALDHLDMPHERSLIPDLEPGPLYRFVAG